MSLPFVCSSCRTALRFRLNKHIVSNFSPTRSYTRPSFAPKPVLDLKHIRQNPGLYEQNCIDRNYEAFAQNGWRILELHKGVHDQNRQAVEHRQRNNFLVKRIAQSAKMMKDGIQDPGSKQVSALKEARALKEKLAEIEKAESESKQEMERLALELPNLTSQKTPMGHRPELIGTIGDKTAPLAQEKSGKSHVDIGKELDILDFEASATTSGWGWYFLKNEGALLEQALIQYVLSVAVAHGWKVMTPPSLVYSHIASACGFMPRDTNGETQIYNIAQPDSEKPSLVLAGTAEIPFAGSQANKTLLAADLPLKVIGPSRCYRAEAGARGVDTKGLYRVHEFTKVEMFAWTMPPQDVGGDRFGDLDETSQSDDVFDDMLAIQREILTVLGLHARVLEMPSADLGASASRKVDVEVFFPSRTGIDEGYGEVTSASICTEFQSRRLGTRVKSKGGALQWPWTLNGTAMAIPRVLAALLENGWKKGEDGVGYVEIPPALREFVLGKPSKIMVGGRKEEPRGSSSEAEK